MLPLALRDLVSLCNMPYVINSHGKDFITKNFAQSNGQYQVCESDKRVGKKTFREWEVVSVGGFYVNADMGCNVVTSRVAQ